MAAGANGYHHPQKVLTEPTKGHKTQLRNGDNTNRGGNNSKNGGFKYVEIKKKKNRKNNRNSSNNNNNTNRNNHSTNVGVTAVNSSNVEINFDKKVFNNF